MKIVVCVKQVPDSWAEKKLGADSKLDRASVDAVLNELDEYAVEEALRLSEAHPGSHIVALTMGPDRATDALRKALSMGVDEAVHVNDTGLSGSDALATSAVLAAAIAGIGDVDLVMFGCESTDARMSVVPAMVAERLDLPMATFASSVTVEGSTLIVERTTEAGVAHLSAQLPAAVSVVEKINEPRYPSFKGIMAAKKKPMTVRTIADLGLDSAAVGSGGAWSEVVDFAVRPPRGKGTIVSDEGSGGLQLAEYLVSNKVL